MSNTTLTASIIAAEAITILDNELVMAGKVFRGYEDDFDKKVNGYNVGETITIRKPTDFTVRDGAVMAAQDATEGSTTMTLTGGTAWDDTNRSLVVTGATVTASKPLLDMSQTWNAGAVTFAGMKINVTDTASAAGSLLALSFHQQDMHGVRGFVHNRRSPPRHTSMPCPIKTKYNPPAGSLERSYACATVAQINGRHRQNYPSAPTAEPNGRSAQPARRPGM